jgi:tetratricopeptide (TPR) repeat protein
MRAAIYILHDLRASHDAAPQISFTILALHLNTFLINPSAQHHLAMAMQDMTGEWNEEEKLTLAFLRLLPRVSLCEEALLMPLNKQASLISDGLRAAEEACGIAQTLQDLPMYAMLRSIIASTFTQLSQYEAAKQNFDEALTARRSLAQSNRPVYCFDLALSLMNYANLQERFAKPDSARSAFQESVTLYREAAAQNPKDFLPDLARCLSNFGGFLCSQGESTLARVHLEESAEILRPAAANHPAYKRDLAQCLNNLGNVLDELGDPTRAEEVLTEAVSILQPFAEHDTSGTLDHLLVMLCFSQTWPEWGSIPDRVVASVQSWKHTEDSRRFTHTCTAPLLRSLWLISASIGSTTRILSQRKKRFLKLPHCLQLKRPSGPMPLWTTEYSVFVL